MPVLTCPSCRCKLKTPENSTRVKGVCPKCHAPLSLRAGARAAGLEETRHRTRALPRPDADTVNGMSALAATAEQKALELRAEETAAAPADPAPDDAARAGILLRAAALVALAAAGTFALWMAANTAW